MPNFIKNLGLDFFFETEETTMNFIGYLTQNGKAIKGYYDCPTLFNPMGDIDFFVKTKKNEDGKLEVCGVDTHCCGRNIWEMRNIGIDITPKDSLPTERVFIFKSNKDSSGILPIHLINADVLPSFLEDDVVNMQMCAFPLDMNYYANEEDYAKHQPAGQDGKLWLLADGSLMPMNFLVNHAPNEDSEERDFSTDDYILFKGTVKGLYHGVFETEDKKYNTYIRCVIETNYGDLHFAHTLDQIKPEQRDNLEVGAIVSGVCVLSGDVAIKEYTNGIVKDLENNLKLLKQIIVNGEAERMRTVLTEDAVYISEISGKSVEGANNIIERFNYVNKAREEKCFATTATITSIDSGELEYPVDTRCILISYDTEDKYDAIAFVDITDSGDIKRIYISKDSRYHFCADEKPHDVSPLDDIESPESVIEPIYIRAQFHGLIDENTRLEELKNGIVESAHWKISAEHMLESLKNFPQPDADIAFENIFGYLFAKAIVKTINEDLNGAENIVLSTSYDPSEAFEGKISTSFDEEKHNKILELMEKGKQFYKDFKFYMQLGEPDDNKFMNEIKTALIVVQHIGYLYASKGII